MNRKYKLHPGDYELGENEKFYGDMEARGWRLVKRGAYFSRFRPVEPSNARYRIEVFSPGFLDQSVLPEEQLAVFADCGWEYVTDRWILHIFRAPAGSGAPEFYTDPAQQAQTLRHMKRGAVWGWIPAILLWALVLALNLTGRASLGGMNMVKGEFLVRFMQIPSLFLCLGFLLLLGMYGAVRNAWIITRTYRRLKKGVPLDHDPEKRHIVHKCINRTLTCLTVLCLLLVAGQLVGTRSMDLPLKTEEPYLLLSDLGWEGERTSFMSRDSGVTHTRSLLGDYWDTREYMKTSGGKNPQMYQDVYRLRDGRMAYTLADALMKSATFGDGGRNFAPVASDEVDAAWASLFEVVAVKGAYVAYISYHPGGGPGDFDPQTLCAALGPKWAD